MPKEAVFTMKLEPQLRDEFMAETARQDRPASQVMRELMRSYIEERQRARAYDEYVHRKVEKARESIRAGEGYSNEEVEAEFAARRRLIVDPGT